MAMSQADRNLIWGKIVARCWRDEDYQARLLDNPRVALEEAGMDVPAGLKVSVSASAPGELHLVVPPKPPASEMELGDATLERSIGAEHSGTTRSFDC